MQRESHPMSHLMSRVTHLARPAGVTPPQNQNQNQSLFLRFRGAEITRSGASQRSKRRPILLRKIGLPRKALPDLDMCLRPVPNPENSTTVRARVPVPRTPIFNEEAPMHDDEAEKIDAIARKLENRYLSEEPQGTPYIDPWDEPSDPVNIAALFAGRMVRHFFRRLADDETLPIERELLFIEQHPHAAPFVVVPQVWATTAAFRPAKQG